MRVWSHCVVPHRLPWIADRQVISLAGSIALSLKPSAWSITIITFLGLMFRPVLRRMRRDLRRMRRGMRDPTPDLNYPPLELITADSSTSFEAVQRKVDKKFGCSTGRFINRQTAVQPDGAVVTEEAQAKKPHNFHQHFISRKSKNDMTQRKSALFRIAIGLAFLCSMVLLPSPPTAKMKAHNHREAET